MSEEFDPGNEQDVQRAKARARAHRERLDKAILTVMSEPSGRAVLWFVLARGGVHEVPAHASPHATDNAFAEGRRHVVVPLFNDIIRLCPELFAEAGREASGEKSNG